MATGQRTGRERPPLHGVRRARRLGLRETAKLAGIDPGHLWKFERGEVGLGIDKLVRLARVLGEHELAETLEPYTRDG
jgi:transcriptional regulator with XRE-family HTH domain